MSTTPLPTEVAQLIAKAEAAKDDDENKVMSLVIPLLAAATSPDGTLREPVVLAALALVLPQYLWSAEYTTRHGPSPVERQVLDWCKATHAHTPELEEIALRNLYTEDYDLRHGVVRCLEAIDSQRCLPEMRRIVETRDERFTGSQMGTVFQLLRNEPLPADVLLPYIESGDIPPALRIRLGTVRDPRIDAALVETYNANAYNYIRSPILEILLARKPLDIEFDLVPHLEWWMGEIPFDKVRGAHLKLVELVAHRGDASLTEPLLDAMGIEPSLLQHLTHATYIPDEQKRTFLLELLKNSEDHWRVVPALRALGDLGDPTTLDTVFSYIGAEPVAVATALGGFKADRAYDTLLTMFYSQDTFDDFYL
ncbi:MAG: HEAT repeat domain-containing protein, partial [Chloroflexota bacterium]